jgi:hypothetical protein
MRADRRYEDELEPRNAGRHRLAKQSVAANVFARPRRFTDHVFRYLQDTSISSDNNYAGATRMSKLE